MTLIRSAVSTILKDTGHSVTQQRLAVISLLEGREPMTMYELYALAKGELDKATLYRIVALFEKLDVVQRINIGWKYKIELSDKFSQHHHHLTCLACQKVIPINEDELEDFMTNLTKAHAFTAASHQVEIQGYCTECARLE